MIFVFNRGQKEVPIVVVQMLQSRFIGKKTHNDFCKLCDFFF